MANTLGDRIEIIKEENRFEIDPFMKLIGGKSRATYHNWINGKSSPPATVLIKLLTAFPEYNAEWLLMGTGNKRKGNELNEPLIPYKNKGEVSIEIKKILRKMIDNIDNV